MRCLAVCHSELVVRMLDQVLPPRFEVDFLVESRPLARRLHDAGIAVVPGDIRKTETYLKADLSANTCVIVEDNAKQSLNRVLQAVRDAGSALVYVLVTPTGGAQAAGDTRAEQLRARFPEVGVTSTYTSADPASRTACRTRFRLCLALSSTMTQVLAERSALR